MSCCCCCSSVAMLESCSAVAAAVSLVFTPALSVTGLLLPDCSNLCIRSTCHASGIFYRLAAGTTMVWDTTTYDM